MQAVSKLVFIWPSKDFFGYCAVNKKALRYPRIVLRFSQTHHHKLLPHQFSTRPSRDAIPVARFDFPLLIRIPTPQAIVIHWCNCTVHSHITGFLCIVRAKMVCWERHVLLMLFCQDLHKTVLLFLLLGLFWLPSAGGFDIVILQLKVEWLINNTLLQITLAIKSVRSLLH